MRTPLPTAKLADHELVGALSEQFRPVLSRYFNRRRLPERDVEDAIQEVFVRLSRRQGLAGMDNVSGYLFETAASVAIDYQRRANARSSRTHEQYEEQLHAVADHGTDVVIEGKQSLELLRADCSNCRSEHATLFCSFDWSRCPTRRLLPGSVSR